MLVRHDVHLGRRKILEARPAQVLVVRLLGVGARRVDAALNGLAQADGLVLFQGVQVVEPALEQQVSDVLDHFDRVGDAAKSEGIPDGVDLAAELPVSMVDSVNLVGVKHVVQVVHVVRDVQRLALARDGIAHGCNPCRPSVDNGAVEPRVRRRCRYR